MASELRRYAGELAGLDVFASWRLTLATRPFDGNPPPGTRDQRRDPSGPSARGSGWEDTLDGASARWGGGSGRDLAGLLFAVITTLTWC